MPSLAAGVMVSAGRSELTGGDLFQAARELAQREDQKAPSGALGPSTGAPR